MKYRATGICVLSGALLAGISASQIVPIHGAVHSDAPNMHAAARYLDDREIWWQNWPRAQKDQGTVCVSCHTQLPYAMARPLLQRQLHETAVTPANKVMLDSVEKRVTNWSKMIPFYSDEKNGPGKTVEAHATESVLNAVILASYDIAQGHLRPITRTAFDNAWALQQQSGPLAGAWIWQNFHLGPWEGEESGYQCAALLMATVLNAPDGYAKEPEVNVHLEHLQAFLRREYAEQPLLNQLYVLWASARKPNLLTPTERKSLLAVLQDQQQADGGWNTTNMDERDRKDDSPEPTESDGYATGIAVLAMEQAGVPPRDPVLLRGVSWLTTHQQQDGSWSALSINKKRDPGSDPALFMQDAATAYAVLALDHRK